MKFERYIKATPRPISNRRLAAAKRSLQRQADEVALFPELAPTQTPLERCQHFDQVSQTWVQSWRNERAARWRKARKQWNELSEFQAALVQIRYVHNHFMPGDPTYLLDIIRDVLMTVK